MDKNKCPFCGSNKLKFHARIVGQYDEQHYIGQVHCSKCGARGPIARNIPKELDRFKMLEMSDENKKKLEKEAFDLFNVNNGEK